MKKILLIICCIATIPVWSHAQDDCKQKYDAAMNYYNKGEYEKAASMFKNISQSNCGSGYMGSGAKEQECYKKIEDIEFKKCTTISACDSYLSKYPNGRYVSDVKNKRLELWELDAEHREEAKFLKCTTVEDCDTYLAEYPSGKYASEVRRKRNVLWDEYLASRGYMDIMMVEFANLDVSGKVISGFGSTLNSDDMKFLTPSITYRGVASGKYVTLNIKIIGPDGKLKYDSNSPSGYTYSVSYMVETGLHTQQVRGWGSSSRSMYLPGNYSFEIWYGDDLMLYSMNFYVAGKTVVDNTSSGDKTYTNGYYRGQMKDGKPHGNGMYYWDSGEFYVGEWANGQKSGSGIYISTEKTIRNCAKCTFYVGSWANDVKEGTGTCYDISGKLLYFGKFANDRPVSKYPDSAGGSNFKFKMLSFSKDSYFGETNKSGVRDGKGVYLWDNGDLWYGKWKDGDKNGAGFHMTKDGTVTTGTWKYGVKQ